jgi:cellulose synthase/poly-beta-1,6-N-acetylglucosamine synthase-like glycosyltransferase
MTIVFALYAVMATILLGIAVVNLWWMLDAWRTPDQMAATRFDDPADPRLSFSLLVPARHEEHVLGDTLDAMADLDHPDYEILVIVGHDDHATAAVARAAARRHPHRVRVVLDHNWPKNKPKALNSALPRCRGTVVGVFDAEDTVAPELLRHVDSCFQRSRAHIVQGGVQLMNVHTSWYALRNVLEYFFWFRSRLHFHARAGFIPLGGNTVFFRRQLLARDGGWDNDCLAEDCEIGVRFSTRGAKVAVAYSPELVTQEETPHSIRELVKQRTRWNQGFLQVMRKGTWRRLPTANGRVLARLTLAMPFLQAFAGATIPLALITLLLLDAPVLLTLLSFSPILVIALTVLVEAVGLHEFCAAYGKRVRLRDYLRLILGTPLYQAILAFAALRAATREIRGQRGWEKTSHIGAHRPQPGLETT